LLRRLVTNAAKHGGAKKILIRLAKFEDKCILTIPTTVAVSLRPF
jgi:signal transduction histidine kinase